MDFNVFVKDDVIKSSFYIYKDVLTKEWHFCNDIDDIKEKLKVFYSVNVPVKENNTTYTQEEIDESLKKISEDDLHLIEVSFKRPNFKINSQIVKEVMDGNFAEVTNINPLLYNTTRIKYLLSDWSLTKGEEPLPINEETIGQLPSAVMDGIVSRLNARIPHYFGNTTM